LKIFCLLPGTARAVQNKPSVTDLIALAKVMGIDLSKFMKK